MILNKKKFVAGVDYPSDCCFNVGRRSFVPLYYYIKLGVESYKEVSEKFIAGADYPCEGSFRLRVSSSVSLYYYIKQLVESYKSYIASLVRSKKVLIIFFS
jgi:hypothetical protein